jgi:hypothetical protein
MKTELWNWFETGFVAGLIVRYLIDRARRRERNLGWAK